MRWRMRDKGVSYLVPNQGE